METGGYRFGAYELDAAAGELRRRGLRVRLRGRPIEILKVLLEHDGQLVTRDALRARLWTADTYVDFDHGLNSAVNKLREALDDTADNPRFIETVPRRGYRWIGPIEATGPQRSPAAFSAPARVADAIPDTLPTVPTAVADIQRMDLPPVAARANPLPDTAALTPRDPRHPIPPPRPRSRVALVAAGCLLALLGLAAVVMWHRPSGRGHAPASGRAMIVVLPFDTVSAIPGQDFFGDGITDEMIAQLGALDPVHLGVIARTTATQYKRSTKGVMEIGRELGVGYVLEGSVRRDSRRARISVRLVDVASQTQLWSETYERDLDDVLMLQRDVASRIAQSLAGGVLSQYVARPTPIPSPPFAAYELVLRARMFRQQASEAGAWRCVETIQEALRVADRYAPAHAALADCYRLLGAPGWEAAPPADLLERAARAASRALELDPTLPEGYAVRGMVRLSYDWNPEGARRDLEHAITLNPSYARAHQYLSAVFTTMGRFDEAVRSARRARDLDPLSNTENTTLGVRLYYAGRYPDAIRAFERAAQVNPDFPVVHWGLGQTYRELGRHPEAIAELRRAVQISNGSVYMRAWLAHALAAAGERAEAAAIRRDLQQIAAARYVSPFLFALMASGFGEREQTLAWLEKTFDARSGWMPFVPVEPELAWLRRDPRFEALVARLAAAARTRP